MQQAFLASIQLMSQKSYYCICFNSVGCIFRGFAIFVVFTFVNSWLLGTVVLKYSWPKYLQIYRVILYTITVYGSCRGANLLDLLLDSFGDVIVSNGELHLRISHLHGDMEAFHWRKASLCLQKKQQRRSVHCCNEDRH